MNTRRIVFLVILLASIFSGEAPADLDYVNDASKWAYGNHNAGNEFTSSILAIPGRDSGGTRLVILENSNNGRLLGSSQEQQSARVYACVGGNGHGTLTSNLSIGGTNIYSEHLHFVPGLPILPTALKLSHAGWHFLAPVHQRLWGVLHLRAHSALHVSHRATAQRLNGDPSVISNTSVRRYGIFEAFVEKGGRKNRILSRTIELFDGLRTAGITATMHGFEGVDAHRLQRQKVNLTLPWPGFPRPTMSSRLTPHPHRLPLACWKFSGVDQVRVYGLQD